MICRVQKQGLVEIKHGKNFIFFSVFRQFNKTTYCAFPFFFVFSRRLKFPCSRRKLSLKKHLSLLFVPEGRSAISAGKTINLPMTKGLLTSWESSLRQFLV